VIGVPTFLIERLDNITEDRSADDLVFTTRRGAVLRSTNWRTQVWLPALKRAGLDSSLRTHDLRHFCASVLISSGASPTLVARQLGHSSPRVTLDIYSHLFPDELADISDRLHSIYQASDR
jgi:integrase